MTEDISTGKPPLAVPLCSLFFSTICLSLAFLGAAIYPNDFIGAYYHARLLALTHLITLGWLTANIFGLFYVVAPIALRTILPAGKWDFVAFCFFAIGLSGMVSHFFIRRDPGMAWSAGCVYAAIVYLSFRGFRTQPHSRAPGFVKLHVYFAFSNILIAATWGLLIAINKVHGFLPTTVTSNIFAHAHLAAIGWICMMVFGISYRLLPMFLPGEPAKGKLPWISGLLLETGAWGLFVSLLMQSRFLLFFALLVVAGFALFVMSAIRTVLRRKPAPLPLPPKPDFALLQVAASFLWLTGATGLGLAFAGGYFSAAEISLRLVYAFVALVGFLGQMVIAMRPKILSIFTWYHAFARYGNTTSLPRPVDMPVRLLQGITFVLWILGIPLFAAGMWMEHADAIRIAAGLLLASVITSASNEIRILSRIFRRDILRTPSAPSL